MSRGCERLVRAPAQEVADDVQPAPLLVVGVRDVPRRPRRVGRRQHRVAGARSSRTSGCTTCRSMSVSFQILRGSSMRPSRRRVCSSGLTSSQYLMRMIPESTMAFSTAGTCSRKRSSARACRSPSPVRRRRGCTSCDRRSRPRRRPGSAACSAGCTSATVSRSVGADSATTLNTRGLTRSVMRLIVPPLPAVIAAFEHDATLAPVVLTHSCSATSSAWRRAHLALVVLRLHLRPRSGYRRPR